MISFIVGKPGGGKGMYTVKQIIDELRRGKRSIITNFPIMLDPWVDSTGKPHVGLLAYLEHKYQLSPAEVRARIFILKDEQCAEFFLYRVHGGALVRANPLDFDGNVVAVPGPIEKSHGAVSFDNKYHNSGGVL